MRIPRLALRWPWPRSPGATEATQQLILAKVNTVNQGLIDLGTAVASLQAMETTIITELQTLSAAAGDPDTDVETLAQAVNTAVANINAAIPQPAPAPTGATSSASPAARAPGS